MKPEDTILFKSHNNYYKFKNGKFYSYGKGKGMPFSLGSWFNCGEEETNRLRAIILKGDFELKDKLPEQEAV